MTGWKRNVVALGLLSACSWSCGDRDRVEDGTGPGDTVRPGVVAATPDSGATDIGLATPITVTFSEAMDPATLTDATIALTGQGSHSRIDYDAANFTATVTLDTLLTANQWYTILVSEGAADEAGNSAVSFSRSFQTGPADCLHIADRFESNEDASTATPVRAPEMQRQLTACGDDRDVYSFTLGEARKITVTTPILDASADSAGPPGWQIHYMNEDGQYYSTLGTSAFPGSRPAFKYTFLPGTYYVEVFTYDELGPGRHILYDLEVSADAPCEDDPYEDNDFQEVAAPLELKHYPVMKACYLDQDCYTVPVTAGQTLVLILDATVPWEAWGHRRINLRLPGGATADYEGTENPDTLEIASDADGLANIAVRFWTDGVDYSLDLHHGN